MKWKLKPYYTPSLGVDMWDIRTDDSTVYKSGFSSREDAIDWAQAIENGKYQTEEIELKPEVD